MFKETLNSDLKAAMLAGDKPLVNMLRDLKSAILNREVADNKRDEGLDEATILSVLKKEQKSRKESMDIYVKAGATERAELERYQLEVIQKYLPAEMSEDEVKALVDAITEGMDGELTMKDMGRIIGAAKQEANNVDGSLLASIIKEKLAK